MCFELQDVLGYCSAICMVLQWAPQIYMTYRMKGPGSLSVLMIILQVRHTHVTSRHVTLVLLIYRFLARAC
jgi:hypothetical protein